MANIEEKEARLLEIWNKYPKLTLSVEFSCGGGQMNDLYVNWFDLPSKVGQEVDDLVWEIVRERCSFDMESDGYYQGEYGTITLKRSEGGIDFIKEGYSEFQEYTMIEPEVDLEKEGFTQDEIDFLQNIMMGVLLSQFGPQSLFRRDVIFFDKETETYTRFFEMLKTKYSKNEFWEEANREAEKEHGNFDCIDDSAILCTDNGLSLWEKSCLQINGKILTLFYEISGNVSVPL